MSKTTVDRRNHPRVETNLSLQVSPEEGGVVARMVTRNLSLEGLYCTSSANFPEMTRLAIRLCLPIPGNGTTEPLDLEAVVVRSEEIEPGASDDSRYRLGLFFTGVEDTARERLATFLAER